MAKYRVNVTEKNFGSVTVEADSFDEAFEKAKSRTCDWNKVEVVGNKPVNATDENGNMENYK